MIRLYVYICVNMCIMNMPVHRYVYVFFPCYLLLKMTVLFCLYPILSFNKVYLLYLQSLPI